MSLFEKKARKKLMFPVFLAVLSAFVLTAALTVYRQQRHFRQAQGFAAQKNWKLALREYDTAIHFSVPFSPLAGSSARGLWQLGRMFEAQGKPGWALMAYSSIRSGFYGTRSFYTPGAHWIAKCNKKIAALDTSLLVREGGIKQGQAAAQEQKYLALFSENRGPSVFWSILAEAGFLGWTASALATIFLGFRKNGAPKGRAALYGALCFLFFAAIWALSLLKA